MHRVTVPTGAFTNVLIRGDFHLKEIPRDFLTIQKSAIFARENKIFTFSVILRAKIFNFFFEIFFVKNVEIFWRWKMTSLWNALPEARLKCPVQIGFLEIIAVFRGWQEFKVSFRSFIIRTCIRESDKKC